ncbi:response regulator [Pseudomonas sp. 165]|uniref:Chemotaxis protein CheA n=1 Tax=Pseudomonas juntendi TaxID=2666183 RepID=A0AAJ5S698_9PSED|nr:MULTISPECIES: response regulator [Pseudomonas]MDM1712496.1 response regulator [Pseudomonas sp. 165]WEA23589.1 response regulator [Pseudomonas juntendi]
MSNKLRIAQLTWLRAPIQKSVDTTKLQLDVFHKKTMALMQPPADAEPIWFENQKKHRDDAFLCVASEVKHIHAALVVAECVGGTSLASEVKIIVNNISDDRLPSEKIEQALISILNGLLTIPKYLGMVIEGAPDSAGILAKQINELRELRGVPLLEEDNLLPPEVEFVFVEPPLRKRDVGDEVRQEVFGRSPKRFQTAFSTYMTNQSKAAVLELGVILRELQSVTYDLEVGCFWWLGECLTEALACGAIRSAGDTLSKIRMLSVAIQKAETDGEEGAKATLGVARFKSLLSVLSMSSKLPPSIEDVLAVFNVRKSVDATSLGELQARIETASAASIKDVVMELKPLLDTAIVSLGRAITSKSPQTFEAQISTFRTSIRQVTSVFYMVNESEMAAVAANSLARVAKIDAVSGFTTELIESLKGDFMFLDEHIRRLDSNETIQSLRIPGVQPDIIANVVEQAIIELAKTRRSITDHLDSGTGTDDLKIGLQRLVGAGAALSFTGLKRAGLLLNGSCQGFLSEMTDQGIKQSPAIEKSARVLVAVEGYLSAVVAGIEASPTLLNSAEDALEELGIKLNHVDVVSSSELMKKFEAAIASDDQQVGEENHFLSEIFELRKVFEQALQKPDVTDRASMEHLYKAAERLAMAAKLNGFDSFHRLSRALGTYSQTVHNQSRDEDFDRPGAEALLVSALEMTFRCMDEYSARGKVSIFTRDVEQALIAKSDPGIVQALSAVAAEAVPQDLAVDPVPQIVLEGELVETERASSREYPDDVDGGHIDMYREEYAIYHKILLAFCDTESPSLTRDMCRAAHTLHGICGSVSCDVLHEVFGVLESRFEVLLAAGQPLTSDDTDRLRQLLDDAHEFMLEFPWTTSTTRLDLWVSAANSIGDAIEEAEFTEITPTAEHVLSSIDPTSHDVHASQGADAEAEKFSHAESFVDPSLEQTSAHDTAGASIDASNPEVDPEYNEDYRFYLDECEDVFPSLLTNVDAWLDSMADKDLVLTIKRNMHTLKGAAMMAEANSIASITHSMESLFESLSIKLISPGPECAQLVTHVMDAITSMTEQMKLGRAYQIPSALIQCLEYCVSTNKIDLTLLNSEPMAEQLVELPLSNQGESGPSVLDGDESRTPTDEVASAVPTPDSAEPMQSIGTGEPTDDAPRPRRKRGGRGKGGRSQTAAVETMAVGQEALPAEPDSLEANEPQAVVATDHGDESVILEVEAPREVNQEPEQREETEPSPAIVSYEEPSVDTQAAIAEPTEAFHQVINESLPPVLAEESIALDAEKFPHAESFDKDHSRAAYAKQAAEDFDKRHSIPMNDHQPSDQPIVSNAVLEMLAREQAALAEQSKKSSGGPAEKIRVELHHLEAAAEKASELIAVRYRLNSLNEEAHLRLTGARELLDANILQHGQLTTALRSYSNNQPHTRKVEDANEADLERFNDLSAIHVAMGAQIDEVREQINEIFSYIRQMRTTLYELDPALTGLQRDLLHSRLVPFLNARQKLFGAVTTACKVTNKDVKPSLVGEDVIMDKMMLDAISDPLTHILRNAIDHGIESPSERAKLGKPADGSLKIKASRRAKHIIIEISDDGRGIDIEAVRRKAIQMNIISETDRLSPQETMKLITRSGFSTAAKVTQVSGRGVGMDIVATTVESLGGRLNITSEKGKGTQFIIELPFTIGSNKAMMVSSGSQWFAIQSYSMCQVLLVDRKSLDEQRASMGHATVSYENRSFNVVHLADLVAMPDSRGPQVKGGEVTLILCEQGEDRIAIEVAKVDSMPEIHIRKLEGMLANVRGIVGETEMQDGSPIFVLDVMEMARLNLKQGAKGYQVRQNRVRSMKVETKPTVLVVDDSRPYRAQLERIFTGFGYTVTTAVDGQDALHKLSQMDKPDLMLVDVEMPNMNGFEFTEAVRKISEYDDTPIIMITTRTGLEEKAIRAGVTRYLLKPCDAESLQQAVNQINAQKNAQGAAA